jgi:hypothetical protein
MTDTQDQTRGSLVAGKIAVAGFLILMVSTIYIIIASVEPTANVPESERAGAAKKPAPTAHQRTVAGLPQPTLTITVAADVTEVMAPVARGFARFMHDELLKSRTLPIVDRSATPTPDDGVNRRLMVNASLPGESGDTPKLSLTLSNAGVENTIVAVLLNDQLPASAQAAVAQVASALGLASLPGPGAVAGPRGSTGVGGTLTNTHLAAAGSADNALLGYRHTSPNDNPHITQLQGQDALALRLAHEHAGRVFVATGNRNAARRAIDLGERAMTADSHQGNLCRYQGLILALTGALPAGLAFQRAAAQALPGDASTHIALAKLLQLHGDLGAAREAIERARHLGADSSTLLLFEAGIQLNTGEFAAAIETARHAVARDGENKEADLVEITALFADGDRMATQAAVLRLRERSDQLPDASIWNQPLTPTLVERFAAKGHDLGGQDLDTGLRTIFTDLGWIR